MSAHTRPTYLTDAMVFVSAPMAYRYTVDGGSEPVGTAARARVGGVHVLGEPVDLVAAPALGPEAVYICHQHPVLGWVREFQIDGSRATVFP